MGRRSDHTRPELEGLFIEEGLRQLSETGLQRFSAREVAKQVGYSVGTLYNVFGSLDGLILALNARTLSRWAAELRARLAASDGDRIATLVSAYFQFATDNPKLWIAIFETRMADGGPAPDWYQALVANLLGVVASEVAVALPGRDSATVLTITRSLVAVVHGHCAFALYRTFDMLGETHPIDVALERVNEALQAARLGS
jgi:AcrR family transcriptional regulator